MMMALEAWPRLCICIHRCPFCMCTRAPARTSVCDPPIRVECSRLWRLDPLTRVTLLENCAICCVRYGLLSLWRITRDTFLCPFHTYLFRGFECATPLVDNDICISYLLSFFSVVQVVLLLLYFFEHISALCDCLCATCMLKLVYFQCRS